MRLITFDKARELFSKCKSIDEQVYLAEDIIRTYHEIALHLLDERRIKNLSYEVYIAAVLDSCRFTLFSGYNRLWSTLVLEHGAIGRLKEGCTFIYDNE